MGMAPLQCTRRTQARRWSRMGTRKAKGASVLLRLKILRPPTAAAPSAYAPFAVALPIVSHPRRPAASAATPSCPPARLFGPIFFSLANMHHQDHHGPPTDPGRIGLFVALAFALIFVVPAALR
eukprot:CAMPEP_0182536302 /NCGR_PEP_ID=MMETSP1323-20130603/19753_1 /TAXON_ID=236787 /ORGANISM="Florenciella parvula, Strain RCC1693" /LENGTH=123 /DNA_ID=CAMNT_0024746521 /DNA_START=304 /DNA_END=671 /DNA_ORIENTATION=+